MLNIKNEKSTLDSIEKRTKKDYNKRDMITNEEDKDRIKEYAKQWKQDNPSMLWLYGVGHRTATCVLELGAR